MPIDLSMRDGVLLGMTSKGFEQVFYSPGRGGEGRGTPSARPSCTEAKSLPYPGHTWPSCQECAQAEES